MPRPVALFERKRKLLPNEYQPCASKRGVKKTNTMTEGRFDANKLVYLAGSRARERGRKLPEREFRKAECLRRDMCSLQKNCLEDPNDEPELKEGTETKWTIMKLEYDALFKGVRRQIQGDEAAVGAADRKERKKDRKETMAYSAEKATKSHIHESILHAQALSTRSGGEYMD